ELAEIRRSGIAYCIGEDVQGFAGIACPIHIRSAGVIYSLAVTGTVDSLIERNRAAYEALLRPLAARVAAAIPIHRSRSAKPADEGRPHPPRADGVARRSLPPSPSQGAPPKRSARKSTKARSLGAR